MRILILSNFYPPVRSYGYAQWCCEVAGVLNARGHTVSVLTSRHQREAVDDHGQDVQRILYLQTRDLNRYRPVDFVLTRRREEHANRAMVERAMGELGPDVVFVWGMWNLSRFVPWHAEQMNAAPVAYYVSDLWPAGPDAHAYYWELPTHHRVMRWPKAVLRRLALAELRREGWPPQLRFDHAICVSEYIRDALTQAGLPFAQAAVIRGGTDMTRFLGVAAQKPDRGADGSLRLLYAGQLAEHKGVHTAIRAMDVLRRQYGDDELHLDLVGSGHASYEDRLRRDVRTRGLEAYVSFCGRVTRGEMPAVLAGHDVLVFPTEGPEAFPRMTQEAMAVGLAVVGTTTGGTGELLADRLNGLVFAPGDASDLAACVAELKENPDLRTMLARTGQRDVRRDYTLDRMVTGIEAYLMQVVAR